MAVEACQHCHGQGTVLVERIVNGKSTWVRIKCPAGCRDGKVNKKLI